MTDLNDRILAAHEAGDIHKLAVLYQQAAQGADEPAAQGFFLTQSYVFALEAGLPFAVDLKTRLVELGREIA